MEGSRISFNFLFLHVFVGLFQTLVFQLTQDQESSHSTPRLPLKGGRYRGIDAVDGQFCST